MNGVFRFLGLPLATMLIITSPAAGAYPGPGGGGSTTNAITERMFSGLAAADQFGTSVSGAGDVNGDGYEDIIVGAPGAVSSSGRAYIFYGGAVFNLIADVVLTGAATSDFFGNSVAGAGDVNGDGYDDVIVGAYGNDAGGSTAGRAYVYFGGAVMNATADVIMTGEAASDLFGYSVGGAGDVNGDGYMDVLVGAYSNDAGGGSAGRAYVFLGGSPMNNVADVVMTGLSSSDVFGYSLDGAGDVNGDGLADVIVGARFNETGGTGSGQAYMYFGGSPMNNVVDVTLTGANGENFGESVTGAGDLDGDGFHDVAVGAPLNDGGLSNAGAVFVFYGGSTMNNIADVTMYGPSTSDNLGGRVSGLRDVNGDGYDDLLAGASLAGDLVTGGAYVYLGGSPMNSVVDAVFTGEETSDRFGLALGSSDYNGDGYPEMLVGAYAYGINLGRAYLYQLSATGLDIPDEVFTGTTQQRLGISMSGGGDMNNDGFDEFVIVDATTVRMFLGGPTIDKTDDWRVAAANNSGRTTPAPAGDLNGDGYEDLIIAQWDSNEVYLYFGGAVPDTIRDRTITAPAGAGNFGISVAGAGDVNGDGFDDIVIGAPQPNTSSRAYIYFGGSSMNTTPDVTFTVAFSEGFGGQVAGGDINGDGYSDVAVGQDDYDIIADNAGRVYVYLGGAVMDNIADAIFQGTYEHNRVGSSVAIGDVNGDAYADLIVGNSDSIYIAHGGTFVDTRFDVFLVASEILSYCRFTGDVNGDGYGDVFADGVEGSSFLNKAFVFFGGPAMDSSPDVILEGEGPGFGRHSIMPLGDINNDGLNDLIVSDPLNDTNGTWSGIVYVYLSSSTAIHPKIISVKDVPFDQGGHVVVTWLRSGFDIGGPNQITDYVLQRSLPPQGNTFVWSNITVVPATLEPRYSHHAETPYDSSASTSGTFHFRVIARRGVGLEAWASSPVPGRSIDNLSPVIPQNPMLTPITATRLKIHWTPNTSDPDFHHYVVYRSTANGFPLADSTRLTTSTSPAVDDSSILASEDYYYRVTAVDVHDNESMPTGQLLSPNALSSKASVKVFLEGPFNNGSFQMNNTLRTGGHLTAHFGSLPIPAMAVDSITIELRTSSSASGSTTRKFLPAWLLTDGTIRGFTDTTQSCVAFDTLAGDYHVVVYHRNHIPIMTSTAQALNGATPLPYDFTTAQGQAFGSNAMKGLAGGLFGMAAGDASSNAQVANSDINSIIRPALGQAGYRNADTNLNGQVQNSDINVMTRPNLGRGTQVPTTPIITGEKEADQ